MTLGQRIQTGRMELGLSQEGLGEKLGVSRQAVSKWEADAAVPDTDKLIALSKLFGLSLNELLQVEPPVEGEKPDQEGRAPKEEQPVHSRRHPRLAAVLACLALALGLTAYTVAVGRMLGRANDHIVRLERRVEELESRGSGLDPTAALVSDFDYTIQNDRLYMDLLPRQLPEGLAVTFTVTAPGQEGESVPGERQAGDHYTAALFVGGMDNFTISAVLSDGESRYTQALVRILTHGSNSWSWESLWDK